MLRNHGNILLLLSYRLGTVAARALRVLLLNDHGLCLLLYVQLEVGQIIAVLVQRTMVVEKVPSNVILLVVVMVLATDLLTRVRTEIVLLLISVILRLHVGGPTLNEIHLVHAKEAVIFMWGRHGYLDLDFRFLNLPLHMLIIATHAPGFSGGDLLFT